MEINKIISNLNILGVSNVSETSKKGEVIKAETTNSNVQDVDENSQLQTNNQNYKFKTITEDNEEELRNTKGTTYLVLCTDGCQRCKRFAPELQEIANSLGDKANFMKLDMKKALKTDFDFKLIAEVEGEEYGKGYGYPAILKLVDGNPVEFMDFYEMRRNGLNVYNSEEMTTFLDSKIDGNIEKTTETKEQSTTIKEEPSELEILKNKKENNEQLVLKQKLDSLKQNLEVMNEVRKEITTDTLENAISNATSISDLKDVISMYSSSLDFELQINLSSVVNEFNSDDDVDSAKEQLLEML